MKWFEEQYVFDDSNPFKKNLKIWKISRGDVYILWKGISAALDCFSWQLNYKEQRIQFTIESQIESILPFLDLSIKRCVDKLITKVYRKDTHTQRHIHWLPIIPNTANEELLKV